MTLLGVIFWGTIIVIVGAGFILEKKYGIKAREKSIRELENEQIASTTHNNDRPRF